MPGLLPSLARAGAAAAAVLAVAGCGQLDIDPTREVRPDLTVFSPAVIEGEPLPERFTCEGEGISPPLQWSGVPAETDSVAVVLDAPQARGGTRVQWVVVGLEPEEQELAEGEPGEPAVQLQNALGDAGYEPPCPEEGTDGGEYRFTVYALSGNIELGDDAELAEATAAIAEQVLAFGRLHTEQG